MSKRRVSAIELDLDDFYPSTSYGVSGAYEIDSVLEYEFGYRTIHFDQGKLYVEGYGPGSFHADLNPHMKETVSSSRTRSRIQNSPEKVSWRGKSGSIINGKLHVEYDIRLNMKTSLQNDASLNSFYKKVEIVISKLEEFYKNISKDKRHSFTKKLERLLLVNNGKTCNIYAIASI